MDPTISVIIPIFNSSKNLYKCLESIQKQSFKNFEVIMINDGSYDNSYFICKEFLKLDKRFKIICQENKGSGESRNEGLKKATGQFIAFLDSDDFVHNRYLEFLYETIKAENAQIVICNYTSECNNPNFNNDFFSLHPLTILSQEKLYRGLFRELKFMSIWGKLYNKKILENEYFIENRIAEDIEFNCRVYSKSQKCCYIDVPLYFYNNHNLSATRKPFSEDNIISIDSYKLALDNLNSELLRSFALIRLYKVMFSTLYSAPISLKKIVQEKILIIKNLTLNEFFKNKYILLHLKIFFFIFLEIPISYRIFRLIIKLTQRSHIPFPFIK